MIQFGNFGPLCVEWSAQANSCISCALAWKTLIIPWLVPRCPHYTSSTGSQKPTHIRTYVYNEL